MAGISSLRVVSWRQLFLFLLLACHLGKVIRSQVQIDMRTLTPGDCNGGGGRFLTDWGILCETNVNNILDGVLCEPNVNNILDGISCEPNINNILDAVFRSKKSLRSVNIHVHSFVIVSYQTHFTVNNGWCDIQINVSYLSCYSQ